MTEAEREFFEERAAIREFEGVMTRLEAEQGATQDLMRWRKENNEQGI